MESSETRARDRLISDFNVSRETMDNIELYRLLILKWAKRINLVGPSTLGHFWQRHALDSAQLLTVAGDTASTVVDFGTGAGLPGLIIAALLRDCSADSHVTLVEVSAKRCGFLREASRTLGVNASIVQEKIEAVPAFGVDLVTARAFAPLDLLLSYANPWAKLGARVVFFKGGDVQHEIDQASTSWAFQSRINTSVSDSRGCIVEILNLKRL